MPLLAPVTSAIFRSSFPIALTFVRGSYSGRRRAH
jgi:hypothetical protein